MTNPASPINHMTTNAVEHTNNIMKSNRIWFNGCQSIMHSMAMDAQTRYELGLSNWAAFSKAKSTHEALKIQVDHAHTAMQRNLDGSTRLNNTAVKLVQDTLAPITASLTHFLEKTSASAE